MLRILRLVLLAGAAVLVAVCATPLAYYAAAPLRVPVAPQKSDVIVLLSSGEVDDTWLDGDGAQRTWGALWLYRAGYAPVILSSGSQHAKGLKQAELQAEWLRRAGVPAEALLVETRSRRTYESAVEVRRLMAEHGWRTAVIVTTELDVPRVRLVFRKLGVNGLSFLAVPGEKPPEPGSLLYIPHGFPLLYHAFYEYAGLALYKWKGWI